MLKTRISFQTPGVSSFKSFSPLANSVSNVTSQESRGFPSGAIVSSISSQTHIRRRPQAPVPSPVVWEKNDLADVERAQNPNQKRRSRSPRRPNPEARALTAVQWHPHTSSASESVCTSGTCSAEANQRPRQESQSQSQGAREGARQKGKEKTTSTSSTTSSERVDHFSGTIIQCIAHVQTRPASVNAHEQDATQPWEGLQRLFMPCQDTLIFLISAEFGYGRKWQLLCLASGRGWTTLLLVHRWLAQSQKRQPASEAESLSVLPHCLKPVGPAYRILVTSNGVADSAEIVRAWNSTSFTHGFGCHVTQYNADHPCEALVVLDILDRIRAGHFYPWLLMALASTSSRKRHKDKEGPRPLRSRTDTVRISKRSVEVATWFVAGLAMVR